MARSRSGLDGVFDTNILIDYLVGRDEAREVFDRHTRRGISIVSWMELQVGARSEVEADVVELFLREFTVVDVTRRIARMAVALRRRTRIRLPDAIIWASAQVEDAPLLTRNTKDFPEGTPGVLVPYR
jgi:predicted nucleic acid-binding protein